MGYLQLFPDRKVSFILEAIRRYILEGGRDIPTPYDLNKILNPKPEPLCPRFYSAIQRKKRNGDYLTHDEKRFIAAYEGEQFKKLG